MAMKSTVWVSIVLTGVTVCLLLPDKVQAQAVPRKTRAVTHERVLQSGQKQFDRLDTNKDGVVDQTEYAVFIEEEVAKLRARLLKRFADDNSAKDGRLTAAEFMAGREKWFQGLDTNHDGTIDQNEFQAGRRGGTAAPAPAQ